MTTTNKVTVRIIENRETGDVSLFVGPFNVVTNTDVVPDACTHKGLEDFWAYVKDTFDGFDGNLGLVFMFTPVGACSSAKYKEVEADHPELVVFFEDEEDTDKWPGYDEILAALCEEYPDKEWV